MKLTFASLSRTFRALAALERIGAIKTVTFGDAPRITMDTEAFRQMFPDIKPERSEYGTLYRAPIGELEVLAWET